jgi:hypothetical protein
LNSGIERDGVRIAWGGTCWGPVCLGIGIMVGAVVMRVDGGSGKIVICTLRVGDQALLTRDTLELCFCRAQFRAQCGVVGALQIKRLAFEIVGLTIVCGALEHG